MGLFFRKNVIFVGMMVGVLLHSYLLADETSCQKKEKNLCDLCSSEQSSEKHKPHKIEFRHLEGDGIGYKRGYSTTELFLSHGNETHLIFFDGRGHFLNQGRWAMNGGIGYRYYHDGKDLVYGVNLFGDYRETHYADFCQVGAGLEVLAKTFNFRANGYFPVGKTSKTTHAVFDGFVVNYAYVRSTIEQTMWGMDSEIEGKCYSHQNIDLNLAFGGYYFMGVKSKVAAGLKARAEARFCDCVYVKAMSSYDRIFRFNLQGEVGLCFSISKPFASHDKKEKKGSCRPILCKNEISKRMTSLPIRQDLIVLTKAHDRKLAKDPSGVPYFFYHVDNTSDLSLGTAESPFKTLVEAQTASVHGETIYVHAGDETSFGMSKGITLKNYQRLLGSGVAHWMDTPDGPVEIIPQTPGLKPGITNDVNNATVVTLTDGSEVSGFRIIGRGLTPGIGISALDITQGVKISHNDLWDNGSNVLGLDRASIYIRIPNNVQVGGTLEITDNFISSTITTSTYGIYILAPSTCPAGVNVKIDNNKIVGNRSSAIVIRRPVVIGGVFKFTGEINNNLFSGNFGTGIQIAYPTVAPQGTIDLNLKIEDNNISGNDYGIIIERSNGILRINRNTIYSNRNNGITLSVGLYSPENLILDMIGNELYRSNIAGDAAVITLTTGTVYARLIDTNNRSPNAQRILLNNALSTPPTFKAEIKNCTGNITTNYVEVVQ